MENAVPGCIKEPPLRACGVMVHLTFAALYDGELDFDQTLRAARRWGTTRQGLRVCHGVHLAGCAHARRLRAETPTVVTECALAERQLRW